MFVLIFICSFVHEIATPAFIKASKDKQELNKVYFKCNNAKITKLITHLHKKIEKNKFEADVYYLTTLNDDVAGMFETTITYLEDKYIKSRLNNTNIL